MVMPSTNGDAVASAIPTPGLARGAFLYGSDISHALAPVVHHTVWKLLNLPWRFTLLDSTDTSECLRHLASPDCVGCSITMPNKLALIPHMDELTAEARAVGAINTVSVQTDPKTGRRRYIGTNTDIVGIRDALVNAFPAILKDVEGRSALVYGAGGAARAAIYALWRYLGIKTIFVVNRLHDEARTMMSSMTEAGVAVRFVLLESVQSLETLVVDPIIATGTAPDIVPSSADERKAWNVVSTVLERRSTRAFVLDMAYTPDPATTLIKLARKFGWETVTGVDVVGFVCMAQDRLWCEQEIPNGAQNLVAGELHRALRQRSGHT
ncbi:uncharacterized protein HMPREF1541_05527 [Cyphellophora europaea CBS 101466]|uniref:Shikimate dehydrogenase substrate binding N-terminal domain-containing protein n=1 Tax=Cyphellophora europaea (strain CBS 101466) TaxID=1220924 RepID=W2RUB0_CYPE1|nr:uncharacterized protein HMPREF1541_05527 [Cyphellophora europaea CBS 101466]ETN39304.1 hypothetical protein HMPREF1541_05527 [Cyphellophora europaea CBS 101466]